MKIKQKIVDKVFETAISQFWDTVNLELRETHNLSTNEADKYINKIAFELEVCYKPDIK